MSDFIYENIQDGFFMASGGGRSAGETPFHLVFDTRRYDYVHLVRCRVGTITDIITKYVHSVEPDAEFLWRRSVHGIQFFLSRTPTTSMMTDSYTTGEHIIDAIWKTTLMRYPSELLKMLHKGTRQPAQRTYQWVKPTLVPAVLIMSLLLSRVAKNS